jgi:quinoprotein relay system zinc metallohydrolase 2
MPTCTAPELGRRAVLIGLAAGWLAPARAGPFALRQIAAGIHVHRGADQEADAINGGAIANAGFVVGDKAVAAIDSGGSLAEGRALLAAIRTVTDLPVAYVINTHFHPDHIFGNAAFAGAHYVAHHNMAAALAARGDYYLQRARQELGAAADGLTVTPPDIAVTRDLTLDLGGRSLHLEAWPAAHTDCDLTVRDLASDSWFLGDLLFVRRMPTIDGSLRGWIDLLEKLRQRTAARAIPGHGPESVAWPQAAAPLLAYLTGLQREVRQALKSGKSLEDATNSVGRRLRADWLLFDRVHPRNVAVAFAELDWE